MNTANQHILTPEYLELVKEFGIVMRRKEAQKLAVKTCSGAWDDLVKMGIIEALPIDGKKTKLYALSDLLDIPNRLKENQFAIGEQL